uniref:WAP domain-containing protein n=1 Tax=Sphenodon punctatus TaxID=8508 RepID=A0A8D0L7C8_SPHPU
RRLTGVIIYPKYFSLAVKPGNCPVVTIVCRMLDPPDKCEYDQQCQGTKKCCEGFCGKDCVLPEKGNGLTTSSLFSLQF